MDVLGILMKWLHLTAAVTAVGGAVYSTLIVAPALQELNAEARQRFTAQAAARLRPLAFAVIVALLITGAYNIMVNISGKPPAYHIALTLKLLLALHVFSVLFLLAVPPGANPARDARRPRLMKGAAISGLLVLLLSAYLTLGF